MAIESVHGVATANAPSVVHGFISNSPSSPSGALFVYLPSTANPEPWGPIQWTPVAGVLPVAGQECLVAFDERGIPWLVSFGSVAPSIGRGAALPSAPYDGQEYDYVADATNGVIWRFRYRAASASAYRWELVGGAPILLNPAGETITASTTPVALGSGPEIVVPLAGDYIVDTSCRILIGEGVLTGYAIAGVFGDAIETSTAVLTWPSTGTVGPPTSGSDTITRGQASRVLSLAAGTKLTIKVWSPSARSFRFINATLSAIPVRVG